ncbi:MAG: tRNA-(ms[2]io[6]A)-hydroxylase [Proteobacteria bacterium]|nr:tRNA-(ms[2]io[6]A)-hydroxylase [Pseudomonadota bacterium]
MVLKVETPAAIAAFLDTPTPTAWVAEACGRLQELLLDHANCELKAASTALSFIYRYPERTALCTGMSRLAREELRHFEQARKMMDEMEIPFSRLSASRYAGALRAAVRPEEPHRLLDLLLIGALIEARSCERFATLAPHLPDKLGRFYAGLLASEARHFENYLAFAKKECGVGAQEYATRLAELKAAEAQLINEPDEQFRFHSGPPM